MNYRGSCGIKISQSNLKVGNTRKHNLQFLGKTKLIYINTNYIYLFYFVT